MRNPRVALTQNWDGTCNVTLDGETVLAQKSPKECEEKANYLDIYLTIEDLKDRKIPIDAPKLPS